MLQSKIRYLAATIGALAALGMPVLAQAVTVAHIDGNYADIYYDLRSYYVASTLTFYNTSGGDLVHAQMILSGYQGINNGLTQTVALPTIANATTYNYLWSGNRTTHSLTSYDYDDQYGGTSLGGQSNPACILGPYYCAKTGNFQVTFTAMISGGVYNGQSVFSVFSPTNNATGSFVGWQGLDQNGWSESTYDQHSPGINNSTVGGTLANIDLGVPPVSGVPEPSVYAMLLAGLGLIGFLARRRNRHCGMA